MEIRQFLHKHTRALLLGLALSISLLGIAVLMADATQWRQAWERLSGATLAGLLALSLWNYALRFLRWHTYLTTLGHRLDILPSLQCYLAGFALTVTPGKAGEALRSWLLKQHGIGYSRSLAALLAERVSDVIAMAILALGGIYYYPNQAWLILTIFVILLLIFALFRKPHALRILEKLPSRIPLPWLARRATDIIGLFHHAALLHRKRYLVGGISLGLVAWASEGIGLFLIADALGLPISWGEGITIYAIGILVGALSFLPGGLGGTEAAMSLLLIAEGAPSSEAIIATLICRAATLWFAVAIGVISLLFPASNPGKSLGARE
jgi:glycosyltransferase 2 family protein